MVDNPPCKISYFPVPVHGWCFTVFVLYIVVFIVYNYIESHEYILYVGGNWTLVKSFNIKTKVKYTQPCTLYDIKCNNRISPKT